MIFGPAQDSRRHGVTLAVLKQDFKFVSLSLCQRKMDEEQLKEYQERMKARWAQNAGADGDNGGAESGPSTDTGTIFPCLLYHERKIQWKCQGKQTC